MKKIKEKDKVDEQLVVLVQQTASVTKDVTKEKEIPEVTFVSDDDKQTKLKRKVVKENVKIASPVKNQETRKSGFIDACLKHVNELEVAIKDSKDNIFIREQFKIFTDKIDEEEALVENIVDFGLKLVLANIKGTNEYTDTGFIKMKVYSFKKSMLQKKLQK